MMRNALPAIANFFVPIVEDAAGVPLPWFSTISWQQIISVIALSIPFFLISLFSTVGSMRVLLDLYDTGHSSIKRFFSTYTLLVRLSIASLLLNLLCGLGFVLLIVPGLLFLTYYHFAWLIIIDQRCSIRESFAKSRALVRNNGWQVFLLLIICIALNMVPFAIFQPLTLLALITVYKQLRAAKGL
jgi:uncharacterized membrane protein